VRPPARRGPWPRPLVSPGSPAARSSAVKPGVRAGREDGDGGDLPGETAVTSAGSIWRVNEETPAQIRPRATSLSGSQARTAATQADARQGRRRPAGAAPPGLLFLVLLDDDGRLPSISSDLAEELAAGQSRPAPSPSWRESTTTGRCATGMGVLLEERLFWVLSCLSVLRSKTLFAYAGACACSDSLTSLTGTRKKIKTQPNNKFGMTR
jgi:hypothetical protein